MTKKQIPTDEIRGRECADYLREFCYEQRTLAAEYSKIEVQSSDMENPSSSSFTNPS